VTKVACHAGERTIGPGRSAFRPCNGGLPGRDSGYMSMSEHPSYRGRLSRTATAATAAAERPVTSEPAAVYTTSRRYAGRACCCLAQPAVMAVMPPGGGRQAETELLLCGHHYRISKAALVTAGATILDMRGHRLEGGDWPGDSR
jgi:hypothetical protein